MHASNVVNLMNKNKMRFRILIEKELTLDNQRFLNFMKILYFKLLY